MLQHLKHKLASQRGASLSMALMLFLVVTLVASVAITAATATTGRYARLADINRSYYNTTSAAKLFWTDMRNNNTNNTVHIVRECDATIDSSTNTIIPIENTYKLTIDDEFVLDESTSPITLNKNNASLFEIVTTNILFNTSSISQTNDESYESTISITDAINSINWEEQCPNDPIQNTINYEPIKITAQNNTIKPVNIKLTYNPDSTATFVFKEETESAKEPFRCTINATIGINDSIPNFADLGSNKYHITWETFVTWEAINISTGGDTSA